MTDLVGTFSGKMPRRLVRTGPMWSVVVHENQGDIA